MSLFIRYKSIMSVSSSSFLAASAKKTIRPNPSKLRGFEVVELPYRHYPSEQILLPKRSSQCSAGYDLRTPVAFSLAVGELFSVTTDIRAYMAPHEYLALYPRSSVGLRGIMLVNTVGIIDSDYYQNPKNDGNIIITLHNLGQETFEAQAGDRIAQGIFCRYLLSDDDESEGLRLGGSGHSGR